MPGGEASINSLGEELAAGVSGWGGAGGVNGASGRDALAVQQLHRLQLQLAAWATAKIGMREDDPKPALRAR